jgi:hypothetical protein
MIGIPVRCVSLTTNHKGNCKPNIGLPLREVYDIRVLIVKNLVDGEKALDSENNIQYIIYGNHKSLQHVKS